MDHTDSSLDDEEIIDIGHRRCRRCLSISHLSEECDVDSDSSDLDERDESESTLADFESETDINSVSNSGGIDVIYIDDDDDDTGINGENEQNETTDVAEASFENNSEISGENEQNEISFEDNSGRTIPKHPVYLTYESRLESYVHVHPYIGEEAEYHAKAGFFRKGHNLICFFCGGSFSYWDTTKSDIWEDHERILGRCYFHENFRDAELNTPGVRLAIEMEFDIRVVKKVLQTEIERRGTSFENSDLFVNACIEFQDVQRRRTENAETALQESRLTAEQTAPNPSINPSTSNVTTMDENTMRKEIFCCKVCMEDDIGVVFVPCGHLVACRDCATNFKHCPVCRKKISSTVRTFLP